MISAVQRLLGGLAPPLLAVHVTLGGLAPLAVTVDHGGGYRPWPDMRIVADTRDEDDEMLLLIAEQVLPQLARRKQ